MQDPPARPEPSEGDARLIQPWQLVSATRLAVFDRCARQFFYRYRQWIPDEDRPVLHKGRAVEAAILSALEASPPADAADSLESLLAWATERCLAELPRWVEVEKSEWLANANRVGDWDQELDLDGAADMAARAFSPAFHGREVEECSVATGGDWPGAWALSRPRHTPPTAELFAGQIRVPPGETAWFTGEYDLWYAHSGKSRIVDLKATTRGSAFSGQYKDQLIAYAWMHSETEGRLPDGLELWYLGEDAPVVAEVPTDAHVAGFVERARALFERPEGNEADHAAEPAAMASADRTWCDLCGYRAICDRTRSSAAPEPVGMPLAEASEDGAQVSVSGVVAALRREKTSARGTRHQRIVLADSSGHRDLACFGDDIDRLLAELRRGDRIEVTAARVDVYRGAPGLKVDRRTRIEVV